MNSNSTLRIFVPNSMGSKVLSLCDGKRMIAQIISKLRKQISTNPVSDYGPNTIVYDTLGFISLCWYAGIVLMRSALSESYFDTAKFSEKESKLIKKFESQNGKSFLDIMSNMGIDPLNIEHLKKFPCDLFDSCLLKGGLLPVEIQ
jgi:hypothetical protein